MRKKYFGEESAFGFIRDNADRDGLWEGDATTLAAKFHVTEDDARDTLGELRDRGLIERLVPGTYAIVRWRERDDSGEEPK